MIVYKPIESEEEILQVLDLQKINLPQNISNEEATREGFVTVVHSYDTLKKMNEIEPGIIAKTGGQVIGYLLAMTAASKDDIPVLVPMFELFGNVGYENQKISEYKYLVVGQVCIAKQWRGQGILDKCYLAYKDYFSKKYDFAITEIQQKNQRSVNAHIRIGFKVAHTYRDTDNVDWKVVLWDW